MSTLARDLDQILTRVDRDTAAILERAVRDAMLAAEQRSATAESVDSFGYPIGYFEATAGSFAGEPFDIPDELPMQQREPW